MDLKIKQQFKEVEVTNGKITELGEYSPAEEIEQADELNNLSGDIEKDINRIAIALSNKNKDVREMVEAFPDGKYKLKQYILC